MTVPASATTNASVAASRNDVDDAAPASTAAPNETPSLRLTFGWGLGSMPMSALSLASNVLLMRFMTDSLGVAAGVAATIFIIAKVWDGITDPIVGTLSDRWDTRWGHRLPWMVVGGILTPLALVALYAVPVSGPVAVPVYVTVALLAFATAYTMFMIPYIAMPAELTGSYHGRTQLMSARVVCSSLGSIVGLGLGPWLLARGGSTHGAHLQMAIVVASISLVGVCACLWLLRDAPRVTHAARAHVPLAEQIRAAMSNRSFAWLMLAKGLYFVALALVLTAFPYFTKHGLQATDGRLGLLLTGQTLTVIVSQPLWLWAGRRFDKRTAFLAAAALYALMHASWWFAGPGEPFAVTAARILLVGIAGGGVFLMTQAMLPDAIEADTLRTGIRRAGMFTGVYVLIEKVAGAIGVAFIGAFLSMLGYIESTDATRVVQPASAITGTYLCVSLLPALLVGLSMLAILRYDVDARALERLRQDAKARAAA